MSVFRGMEWTELHRKIMQVRKNKLKYSANGFISNIHQSNHSSNRKICSISSNVNDCSGHGFCTRPDQCTCVARFTGAACDACIDRHWGDDCLPCPDCVNGNCNLTTGDSFKTYSCVSFFAKWSSLNRLSSNVESLMFSHIPM